MKVIFFKASVVILLLIIGSALFFATYFCVIAVLFSKPTGIAEIATPIVWAATAVSALVTLLFLYVVTGFKFKKLSRSVRGFFSMLALWVGTVALINLFPPSYHSCDLYTKAMNGGIRTFQGGDYRIELCGLNGIIEPENFQDDEVRLRVYSMDRELLAERYYAPLLGMRFGIQIDYYDDYLTYDTATSAPTQKIAIPPGRWEWIRARLPRMWP